MEKSPATAHPLPDQAPAVPMRSHGRGGVRARTRKNVAIVPAFNEAKAIAATIAEIRRWAPDFDLLVVDDGSSDATAECARAAGATVIRLPFNLGIGGGMQGGYGFPLEQGYEGGVQGDAGRPHDPPHTFELLAPPPPA